jgi:hypothetical protein
MKKTKANPNASTEMLPEYDFSGKKGVRGKYYQAYRSGHGVRTLKDDGTASLRYFTLQDGAVILEPDVRAYFPDSESVNQTLRTLIALIPTKPSRRKSAVKAR